MSIWRRLIATGLLLLVLSLLVSISHGSGPSGEGAAAQATMVAVDHSHPCSAGPTCSPYVLALEEDAWSVEWPSAPADLEASARSLYLSPHLSADPPPPRRLA